MPRRRDAITEDQFRLVPIRHVDVYREVLGQIEAFISENALKPGDRLPSDRELAERLGVSRASVRQATKVLEGFGRVDAQRGSGTYVKEPSHVAAITGPGVCGADYPLRVSVLGESATLGYGDEPRPPSAIAGAASPRPRVPEAKLLHAALGRVRGLGQTGHVREERTRLADE